MSKDTSEILESQINEAHSVSLMNHWVLGMTNTTTDYFDDTECKGFKDCVMFAFSSIYDLFIDNSIPGVDISRNITSDLENVFLELLGNDSWSIPESHEKSSLIMYELNKLNETNKWCATAPIALTEITNKTALFGASLNLSCIVSGNPNPSIKWFFNNTLIENAGDYELTVVDLDHKSQGLYRCEAENFIASITSNDVAVKIIGKFSFSNFVQNLQKKITSVKTVYV